MSSVRSVSRVPVAGLGLLALAFGLASSAVSAPRVRLRATVSPRQLPPAGGEIEIRLSTGGVPLNAVYATLTRPDRTPLTEELEPLGEIGEFGTHVLLPENEGRTAQTYAIRIFARGDTARGLAVAAGTVRVKGALEVEPIVIESCEATPRRLPSSGGTVRITAKVKVQGRRRLAVKAFVEGGGGLLAEPVMTLRGGLYQASVTVPANTAALPATYDVHVVATPDEGEPVEADCGTFGVAPATILPGIAVTGSVRGLPVVRLFRGDSVESLGDYFPFDAGVEGSATVATADFTGDGIPDFALAAGPGAPPLVRLAQGPNFQPLGVINAFDPAFRGGVNVAAGDVNGDGRAELILGAGEGSSGGHVKVFDGVTGATLASFLAFDTGFTGGVRVAAGDVNGDGRDDIITGAGAGAGPHVKVFDGRTLRQLRSFNAYEAAFAGGVFVAAGDVNGDGKADVITGAGPGGGPQVKVFDGRNGRPLQSYLAYESSFRGGVRVATGDLDGDGRTDVIVGGGTGAIGGHVKVFSGATGAEIRSFLPFDSGFTGGVSVAGVPLVYPTPDPQ